MANAIIKQGQSVKIRFKFDEAYSGIVWVAVYKEGCNKSLWMWNTGDKSLDKVSNTEWTKTLCAEVTRSMGIGNYYIEMLAKENDDTWTSIGSSRVDFSVVSSNIGKEVY